jgi:transcriptional regulator with XRE-family HTH domain
MPKFEMRQGGDVVNPLNRPISLAPSSIERRKELARFLRARREAISPEALGLPQQHRRRTPGLRRDEVALLAGIGAAWYSRLEMAHDVKPSATTLQAIANALQLNAVETEYLFTIAEVGLPRLLKSEETGVPEALEQLVPAIHGVGALIRDRYLTPLRWNAIADALFDFSRYPDPFERNTIIRLCKGHFKEYFGANYDQARRGSVGMFRRAFSTEEPTTFARGVHETAQKYPFFQESWAQQVIEDDNVMHPDESSQFHTPVGDITVTATSCNIARHHGLVLRIYAPADDASVKTFERLRELGSPSTRETRLP